MIPRPGTARNKTYPLARPVYTYTNGQPKEGCVLERFSNLHKTEQGREIVEAIGVVPAG